MNKNFLLGLLLCTAYVGAVHTSRNVDDREVFTGNKWYDARLDQHLRITKKDSNKLKHSKELRVHLEQRHLNKELRVRLEQCHPNGALNVRRRVLYVRKKKDEKKR